MLSTGVRTRGVGGKTRGDLPPWFSDCYISQEVVLTLWLVLALHGGLTFVLFMIMHSSVATVVDTFMIIWYVLAPYARAQCHYRSIVVTCEH